MEAGLKPTQADSYGSTPLHLAVSRNAAGPMIALMRTNEIAELLQLKDAKGRTPLMVAEERGHTNLIPKLQDPELGTMVRPLRAWPDLRLCARARPEPDDWVGVGGRGEGAARAR